MLAGRRVVGNLKFRRYFGANCRKPTDSVTHVLGTADKKIPTPQPLEHCLGNRKAVWNRGEGVLVCLLACSHQQPTCWKRTLEASTDGHQKAIPVCLKAACVQLWGEERDSVGGWCRSESVWKLPHGVNRSKLCLLLHLLVQTKGNLHKVGNY